MINKNINVEQELLDFDNLYRAFKSSKNRRSYKSSAMYYQLNAISELNKLQQSLSDKTYKVSGYTEFMVYRPKERLIKACKFKDKVAQHILCDNILKKYLPDICIDDNYAGQEGKGTKMAYSRIQENIRDFGENHQNKGFFFKGDISKYYYSINHDIAIATMESYFPKEVHWIIREFINSTDGDTGIALGNQINTIVSNLYLDKFDKFILNELKIKHYGRYADDFYLIHSSKEYIKECEQKISEYLSNIDLKLNPKSQIIPFKNGIVFCGFHFYPNGKVVLANDKKRSYQRKFNKMCKLVSAGKIPIKNLEDSYRSYKEHIKIVTDKTILKYYESKLKELRKNVHK